MSAFIETAPTLIDIGAGNLKMFTAKCDGVAGSGGTLTVEEFSTIVSIQITQAEPSTVDCTHSVVYSVSSNVITVAGVEGDGTINTQNPLDFYISVIGY